MPLSDGTHYRESGGGRPIVLIHGVGAGLEMWEPAAALLQRTHRVLRYDMLGHGDSAKPPGPYRLADFVEQLRRLAEHLDLPPFVLAGFSMGGLVAQGFALAHPERLTRLVLLNAVYDRSADESAAVQARVREVLSGGFAAGVEAAIERWFTPDFRVRRPEVVESARRQMFANDVTAYAAAYQVFATADRELAGEIGRISTPTLVVTGSEDRRSTSAMAEALARRLPRGRCEIIRGQRHMTPLEVPEIVAELILREP